MILFKEGVKDVVITTDVPDNINLIDIPINIKYYKYKNKCKYPSSLTQFQRNYYKRIRISHYIYMGMLVGSLFVPNFLILIPATLWSSTLILNYMFSGKQDCFFNVIEFRTSNCNNKSVIDELGFSRKNNLTKFAYIISILIILYRIYNYYFIKK